MHLAKSLAKRTPAGVQDALKSLLNAYRVSRGRLVSTEPEFAKLGEWIKPGDTVIDVGANVGAYTLAMSRLVGPTGRVISFEPLLANFKLLTQNVAQARCQNVTLVNAAVSDRAATVRMVTPEFRGETRAHIGVAGEAVLAVALDSWDLPPVALIKIDVEGHELPGLLGARQMLARDRPHLIVEENNANDTSVREFLTGLGYAAQKFADSPNVVYA